MVSYGPLTEPVSSGQQLVADRSLGGALFVRLGEVDCLFTGSCITYPTGEGYCDSTLSPQEAMIRLAPLPFSITDPDGLENSNFTFTIVDGDDEGFFLVDQTTGMLWLVRSIDREVDPSSFVLEVEFSDGMFSDTLNVSVAVTDVNDNPPVPVQPLFTAQVTEEQPVSEPVVTVNFTDSDSAVNAVLTYFLDPSITDFVIADDTGLISTNRSFDFEDGDTFFQFLVFARDSGTPSLTGSVTVEVTILDINDNRVTIELVPNDVELIEGSPPIVPANITLDDADSFPLPLALVRVVDPQNMFEVLSVPPISQLIFFVNYTLLIAGPGAPGEYSDILSSVMYAIEDEEFELPLFRTLEYISCDTLDVLLSLSPQAQTYFNGGPLSQPLTDNDVSILFSACTVPASATVTVTLTPVNDRPVIIDDMVEFPDISEDLSLADNKGSFVMDIFGSAIADNDQDSITGIAVIGHGSPAVAYFGTLREDSVCRSFYNDLQSSCSELSEPVCTCEGPSDSLACSTSLVSQRVYFQCFRGSSLLVPICSCANTQGRKRQASSGLVAASEIFTFELILDSGRVFDLTSVFVDDQAVVLEFNSTAEYCDFVLGAGIFNITRQDLTFITTDTPTVDIEYELIGDVTESSAVVLGPSQLVQWRPVENLFGLAYLVFRAWDTSNGVPFGSRGVDTTDPTDTSFSEDIGNATVRVLQVNDPPVIRLGGREEGQLNYSTSYTENADPIYVANRTASVVEFDPSDLFLFNLTVTITIEDGSCDLPGFIGDSHDVLLYNDTLLPLDDIQVDQFGQACIRYYFLGRLSVDQWRAFIVMMLFDNNDNEPSDHTRRLSFVISDSISDSEPSFTFIDVSLVSDICPVINVTTPSPVTYIEHSGPLLLDTNLEVTDGDRNPQIASVDIRIVSTSNSPCTGCTLSAVSSVSSISANFDTNTLTLTLIGPATPEEFSEVLQTVSFEETANEPTFDLIGVVFTVRDVDLTDCPSGIEEIGIMIEHINDNLPDLYLDFPNSQDFVTSFVENSAPVPLTGNTVRIMDRDGEASPLYRIEIAIDFCIPAEDILEFVDPQPTTVVSAYDATLCTLTLQGSILALESDLPRLRYRNAIIDDPTSSLRVINFTIFDEPLGSRMSVTELTVTAVNDIPFIDLDTTVLGSSDSMVTFIVGTGRVSVVGSESGGLIEDPDSDTFLRLVLELREFDENGAEVLPPRSDVVEVITTLNPDTLTLNGLTPSSNQLQGIFEFSGEASVQAYNNVLNDLIYQNLQMPVTQNRREITVTVFDGLDFSLPATATITFAGVLTPPVVDLNGNRPMRNVEAAFIITTAPLRLFPDATVTDADSDNICTANINLTGPANTCFSNSISFDAAFADISILSSPIAEGTVYFLSTIFQDCRQALVYQSILQGMFFSTPDNAAPGLCNITVTVTDARGSNSDISYGLIEVRAFNAPPFVDLDLGYPGRDYSTEYFQGGRVVNIVSIFDAATARVLTAANSTVVGEADGEAPYDDGTVYHGVVIREDSNAGYVLRDVDSVELEYLEVEIILSSTVNDDVIRFPCVPPNNAAFQIPEYGCLRENPGPFVYSGLVCDPNLFDACNAVFDLCSSLRVTIYCSTVGRKVYRFQYDSNPLTERYESLLGHLGYEYLVARGGFINQIRLINVTAFDGENANPQALARIKVQNRDNIVIIVDPAPPNTTFIVYENERPNRTCNLYTIRVTRIDGTVPAPSELVYGIASGNTNEAFGINDDDGRVFLNNAVDRETQQFYNLVITARLRDADPDTTASELHIAEVIDVNDNCPQTSESYSVNVTEGLAGAQVVQVIATDADIGINAELTYLLLGIGAEKFEVDPDGLVTTRVPLNVTTQDFYLLVMIISDRGTPYLSTHTVINVHVITPPPTDLAFDLGVTTTNITIFENEAIGARPVGVALAFEVGGLGITAFIRYRFLQIYSTSTLLPEPINPFRINEVSGEIFVNAQLDSERSEGYIGLLEAFSVRNLFTPNSAFINVSFTVNDVNEQQPFFVDAPYNFTVVENTALNTVVFQVEGMDGDAMNRGLIFSLETPIPSNLPFDITSSGTIIVSDTVDYEAIPGAQIVFLIRVRDDPPHGMPPMEATAMVTVDILDRNDNGPVFQDPACVQTVLETVSDGFIVQSFSTTDLDSPANSLVVYTLEDFIDTPFCLVGQTIQVCNASLLTLIEEEDFVFSPTIVATNPPGNSVSSVTQVTILQCNFTLELVNEFDPQLPFDVLNHSGYVEEHCGRGFGSDCLGIVVYDFGADTVDEDGGFGGELSFILESQNVPFSIDVALGVLVINGRIDREEVDFYVLTVFVQDGGDFSGNVRNDSATLIIPISDINDNPPQLVPPFTFNVTEAMTQSTSPFGAVSFADPDTTGTHSFIFFGLDRDPPMGIGCTASLPIQIDPSSGQLSFCRSVDFENDDTVYEFNVRITDLGLLNLTASSSDDALYTVNIIDVNDNPPVFDQTSYDFTINENEPAGSNVSDTVIAMDEDEGANGLLVFSIVNGSSPGVCLDSVPFVIDKISETAAQISACRPLDYEDRVVYSLVVIVQDSAPVPMSAQVPVMITVVDRNDNPPIFDPLNTQVELVETDGSLLMSSVAVLTINDADSVLNFFSNFVLSTFGSPFALRADDGTSVEVFVAQPALIDFDLGIREYVIEVLAVNDPFDPSDVVQSSTTTVTITIADDNDNSPEIGPPLVADLRENEPADTVVQCVNASDIDSGENAELSFFIGPAFDDMSCVLVPFMIDNQTGCISSCDPLDYELTTFYQFEINVCDNGATRLCSSDMFRVNLVDLNDNPPEFVEDPFIINVNENTQAGTSVGLLDSTDRDSALNSLALYSLVNTTSPFGLRSDIEIFYTGGEPLDFEGPTQAYVLRARATNPPAIPSDVTQISEVAVVINVVDRNDLPPVFDPIADTVSIEEHSPIGTVVYPSLSTTDGDSVPNSAVRYEILQTGSPFAIDGTDVIVIDSDAIDRDPPNLRLEYILTIQAINEPVASDDAVQVATFTLTITVLDINDNTPECPTDRVNPEEYFVFENAQLNRDIFSVNDSVFDIDSGLNGNAGLQFFLRGNTTSGDPLCSAALPLSLDPDSGYFSLCLLLDFESIIQYDVSYTVCDRGSPRLCNDQCFLSLVVMDVNDNAPIISPPTRFTVSEDAATQEEVGCVNASDLDSGQNAELSYANANQVCTSVVPFIVNDTSGCIEVCAPLDFEAIQEHTFQIVVSDNGSPMLSTTGNFTVGIININDHAPTIVSPNIANVTEEEGVGAVVRGPVVAVDIDAPPFDEFVFNLLDDSNGTFTIDLLTGVILTTRPLDRETQAAYDVTVLVTDNLFFDEQNLTIIVVDINDNAPEYFGAPTFQFQEELLFEQPLLFRDIDVGANAELDYQVDDTTQFSIDGNGVLRNLIALDRDPDTGGTPILDLMITVTDRGTPFMETVEMISIELIDINDNTPVVTDGQGDIINGTPSGTIVFTVVAEDADEGLNAQLDWTLAEPSDMFDINSTTGEIFLIRDAFLTSTEAEQFDLVVIASDRGIPSLSGQANITLFFVSSLPILEQDLYEFNVTENRYGANIGSVIARDSDVNPFNDDFVFDISLAIPYNPGFEFNQSGVEAILLSPTTYLDFEDAETFNLTITVSRQNMTNVIDDTATVIVTLFDENDNIPRLSPQNISAELPEDAPNGTIIARAIAIDFDTGSNGQLTFNHFGPGMEYFGFDSEDNFIITNGNAIDFERNTSFRFAYEACDPDFCSETGYIDITIVNVDDLPPVFDPRVYQEIVSEAFEASRLVLYVNFTDPDTPLEEIELSLVPPQDEFTILLLSGRGAILTTDVPLDRETTARYDFDVVARDTAGQEDTATVTIFIMDENDQRPRVVPIESEVTFIEGNGAVAGIADVGSHLSIVDQDDLSLYPLTRVHISLRPSPDAVNSDPYPIIGGQCDLPDYDLLFDRNVYNLCSIEGCRYLLDPEELFIPAGGTLVSNVLDLTPDGGVARSSAIFPGSDFDEFTVSVWTQFDQQSFGNIFEVQSGPINVFILQVSNDGSLAVLSGSSGQPILVTNPLAIHDGEWHQTSLVRNNITLLLYFDCQLVASADTADLIDFSFNDGSFFMGNLLSNGARWGEFYFCTSPVTSEDVCCTLTCGESFSLSSEPENVTTSLDLRTRTVDFVYSGDDPLLSLSRLEDAVQTLLYVNVLDEPNPLSRGVFYLVYDMIGPSDSVSIVTVVPILINDQRPVIDLNGQLEPGVDFETQFDETSTGTAIISEDAILYDGDGGIFRVQRIIVELVGAIPGNEELFAVSTQADFDLVFVNGGTRVEIQSSNSSLRLSEEYIRVLLDLRYRNIEDEPILFTREVSFTVYDEGELHRNDPLSFTTVTVNPTNDQPILDLDTANSNTLDTTFTYNEQDNFARLITGTNQAILDSDSDRASSLIVRYISRPDGSDETLQLNTANLPGEVDVSSLDAVPEESVDGVFTLTVTSTSTNYLFATWLGILRAIEYQNAFTNPDPLASRVIEISIVDDGGEESNPSLVFVSILLHNDPPQIFLGGPGVLGLETVFVEDGPCINIVSPDVQITDADSNGVFFAQVQLTPVAFDGSERLVVMNPTEGINVLGDTLIFIRLTSTNFSLYEDALRSIQYCNFIDEPLMVAPGTRTIQVQVTDVRVVNGGQTTNFATGSSTTTIEIMAVNDPPVLLFEPLNNVSVRGIPTEIIDASTVDIDDSDHDLFDRLFIYITNNQDGEDNEIIEFARQLPEDTQSIGPMLTADNRILYDVTFGAPGADRERIRNLIQVMRYNNRAQNITVEPPRNICLQVRDTVEFGPLNCIDVQISPPNNNDPIFANGTLPDITYQETDEPVDIGVLVASDADEGLAGEVQFLVAEVTSSTRFGQFVFTTDAGLFSIDTVAVGNQFVGRLTAPQGFDAEEYISHFVVIRAQDFGNPTRSTELTYNFFIEDINDNAPLFTDAPYTADPQAEGLSVPRVLQIQPFGRVLAVDNDVTASQSFVYAIHNFQNIFQIDSELGFVSYNTSLDAEQQRVYVLNVSATDSGQPPLTNFTTVAFTLEDINDNAATALQLAVAIHVVGSGSSSIGPALRIVDGDIDRVAISLISVRLTPNEADTVRSYDQCLVECQDTRLNDAGLLPNAIDLLAAATFQSDSGSTEYFSNDSVLGVSDCPSVSIRRGPNSPGDPSDDGYGRIPRSSLPDDFGAGEFSITFVMRQFNEGFVFLVPDEVDQGRELAIWVRRNNIIFNYLTNGGRSSLLFRLSENTPFQLFFDTAGQEFQVRHYAFIVRNNVLVNNIARTVLEIYADCILLTTVELEGPLVSPTPGVDLFIGQSRPLHPVTGGRLGADLHGYYYHRTALTPEELNSFCVCGIESLELLQVPDSILISEASTSFIELLPSQALIPIEDAVTALRGITYQNEVDSPTLTPDRRLEFEITEETGISQTSSGFVRLLTEDNANPVVDLNGIGTPGIDYFTTYTEGSAPVQIAPDARVLRDIANFTEPTFQRIEVRILNPVDENEILSAVPTDFISVNISSDGLMVVLQGPGIRVDFETAFDALTYINTNQNPDELTERRISFTVVDTDGRINDPAAVTRLAVSGLNNAPEISLAPVFGDLESVVQFNESSSGVLVAPNATLRDVDDSFLSSASLILISPNLPTDQLTFDATPEISGSYDSTSGVLSLQSLTNTVPLSVYMSVLQSVRFESTDSPFLDVGEDSADRAVEIFVSDSLASSPRAIVHISFVPVNDAPIIDPASFSENITFRDGDRSILIAPNAVIIDTDNLLLNSLQVDLAGFVVNTFLSDGIVNSTVLFYPVGTVESLTNTLRSISYFNLADEPSLIPQRIVITLQDFEESSITEINVLIEDVNDNPPVFSQSEYEFTVPENSEIGTTVGLVEVTDEDRLETIFEFFDVDTSFVLVQDGTSVTLLTGVPLDFETESTYDFILTASDSLNNATARIIVRVEDINEPPSIVLTPSNPAVVTRPDSSVRLFDVGIDIEITDPDFGDSVIGAQLEIRNIPPSSNETLEWTPVEGFLFGETDPGSNVFFIGRVNASNFTLEQALLQVNYVALLTVTELTVIRTVAVSVFDVGSAFSEEATISVSLASVPVFSQSPYRVFLVEGTIAQDFLQVEATVESGGDVITYDIEPGRSVVIDSLTGFLSLTAVLDHEVFPVIELQVFAIDAFPPERTGTATVIIIILDQNDVSPTIDGLSNITVSQSVEVNPFATVTVTDPDTVGSIVYSIITVVGSENVSESTFTQRECVDEYNVIFKMEAVCGLGGSSFPFIDLLSSISSSNGVDIDSDQFGNVILTNTLLPGYAAIGADFSAFEGTISEFTFALWVRAEGSGHIAYYGRPDALERYFVVYYNAMDNQLVVTLKRAGLSGLEAQVRVNFQLLAPLNDGAFHFVMIQYVERELICVVDGARMNSFAVVYKDLIGEVFGEFYTICTVKICSEVEVVRKVCHSKGNEKKI